MLLDEGKTAMISEKTMVRRSPAALGTQVDQDYVLMAGDLTYHGLDRVGSRVWELLEEPTTIDAIAPVIEAEFTVSADDARNDLVKFIQDLADRGLVLEV